MWVKHEYPMCVGEVPEKELTDIIDINVKAITIMTWLVIGQMQKRGRGAIVNISSASQFQLLPLLTVYAATKAYMKSFSDALRMEYSRHGLTVHHLTPFFINTKMNAYSHKLQVAYISIRTKNGHAIGKHLRQDYNKINKKVK